MTVLHRENNPYMRHAQVLLLLEAARQLWGSFTLGLPCSTLGMGSTGGSALLVIGRLRLRGERSKKMGRN